MQFPPWKMEIKRNYLGKVDVQKRPDCLLQCQYIPNESGDFTGKKLDTVVYCVHFPLEKCVHTLVAFRFITLHVWCCFKSRIIVCMQLLRRPTFDIPNTAVNSNFITNHYFGSLSDTSKPLWNH